MAWAIQYCGGGLRSEVDQSRLEEESRLVTQRSASLGIPLEGKGSAYPPRLVGLLKDLLLVHSNLHIINEGDLIMQLVDATQITVEPLCGGAPALDVPWSGTEVLRWPMISAWNHFVAVSEITHALLRGTTNNH